MKVKQINYDGQYKVISIAKESAVKQDLLANGLDIWSLEDGHVIAYPECNNVSLSPDDFSLLSQCNNYDVFEVLENGTAHRYYDCSSNENVFFVTGKCNSNCIMCPSPEITRRNGTNTAVDSLICIAEHIPTSANHFTITGGEPFLIGMPIFQFLQYLQDKFENTEFLILTNGRAFAIETYREKLRETMPSRTILGIPIHASNAALHDAITQSHGSFQQTMTGLKHLLKMGINIELRIVVSKLNQADLPFLAELIVKELPEVRYVSIIAMEMTGNAYTNRKLLWAPYDQAFSYIQPAIDTLIGGGVDVRLYNFPLCTVNTEYWMLCKKSISKEKIRYDSTCDLCTMKRHCGGVFAGTFALEKAYLKPIL